MNLVELKSLSLGFFIRDKHHCDDQDDLNDCIAWALCIISLFHLAQLEKLLKIFGAADGLNRRQ